MVISEWFELPRKACLRLKAKCTWTNELYGQYMSMQQIYCLTVLHWVLYVILPFSNGRQILTDVQHKRKQREKAEYNLKVHNDVFWLKFIRCKDVLFHTCLYEWVGPKNYARYMVVTVVKSTFKLTRIHWKLND